MKYYSQKDTKWAKEYIGKTKYTIGKYGCYITSLAMLLDKTPLQLNNELIRGFCFDHVGLLLNDKAAKLLGRKYSKVKKSTIFPCIGETDHYKKMGYPQHFFVLLDNKTRIDPLDLAPLPEPNDYNVVSMRIFA